jgi:acyl carrier protein
MENSVQKYIQARDELQSRLKKLLCDRLQLPMQPDEMDPDAPLFGTGIDLDSIDAVEIVMIIENEFGIKLRSIVETRSLRTLNTLTDAIMKSEASYVN